MANNRILKDDGNREAAYEGRFEFASGIGKYANTKGDCHYAGVCAANDSFWDAVVEIRR